MIWLAYYLVAIPLLIIAFVRGNRAPLWLFWATIACLLAGVLLLFSLAFNVRMSL